MCLCFAKRTGVNNAKCKSSQGKWETVFFCSQETKSPRSVGARPKKREKKEKKKCLWSQSLPLHSRIVKQVRIFVIKILIELLSSRYSKS